MLNFTVGPVQESKEVLEVGAQPTPYFRNQSFSKIMLENEAMMKELTFSDEESRVVFLTASGTGAMEAAVMNSFTSDDKFLHRNTIFVSRITSLGLWVSYAACSI